MLAVVHMKGCYQYLLDNLLAIQNDDSASSLGIDTAAHDVVGHAVGLLLGLDVNHTRGGQIHYLVVDVTQEVADTLDGLSHFVGLIVDHA